MGAGSMSAAVSPPAADRRRSRRALALTLALMATFTVVELIGGLLIGSLALLADAGHMLSDVMSLGLALGASWLAGRPATPARTFGWQRAEILAAMFNGVTLVAISIWIFVEASRRFEAPPEIPGAGLLAIALAGLVVNVAGLAILRRGRGESLNVRAAARHVLADLLGSVGVIVAGVVILATGWRYIDPLVSVVIGLLVLGSSWSILRDSVRILLEASPKGLDVEQVGRSMAGAEGVVGVHDLHVWTITSGFPALAAHVTVGPDDDCHARRRELERLLKDRFQIEHTTLQVDHHPEPELIQLEAPGSVGTARRANQDPDRSAAPATSPIPPFTAEHERFRAEVREFVASKLRPRAAEWERQRRFPDSVFERLAERGYLGLKYPREYGGQGDHVLDAVLCEELARCGSGGLAAGIGAHTGIATPPISTFGTEDQKRRFLAPAIAGRRIAALGITEPGAGSDVAGIRTRAVPVPGGYRVSGSKTFITNGERADFVVTAVKTTEAGGHGGLSFLILERGMEGFTVSRKLEKLGWHASDTAELAFDDVFVPHENLLGEENRGFYLVMANFQWERLLMALGAIGAMEAGIERTVAALSAGTDPPGGNGQAARHTLAEMATRLQAGRTLTYHALRLFVGGQNAVREVTMAKLATQRASYEVAEAALRLRAAALDALPEELAELDRAARDSRLGPIGGGTDEIMKEILGRQLGL